MKTFRVGQSSGFIGEHVRVALDLPRHIRQAGLIAVAPTKAAAHQLLADHGFHVAKGDSEFRQATGNDVAALAAAGLCDAPAVYAIADNGAVARITRNPITSVRVADAERIGMLDTVDGRKQFIAAQHLQVSE